MLIVDSREPTSVKGLIASDVVVEKLEAGDLLDTETGLLIELKTPPDLLSSIGDGRLYSQCSRMVALSDHPVLLVHGSLLPNSKLNVVADGRHTGWNYWSVQMALISVQTGGVAVVQVPHSLLEEAVAHLRDWSSKEIHREIRSNRASRGIWLKASERMEAMSYICGSIKRAKLILSRYQTPASALKHIDEWDEIRDVGKGTIRKAREIMGMEER